MRTYFYLLSLLAFFAFSENTDIEEILTENESNFSLSEKSQSQVNDLSTEKDSLLAEWKVVVKQVEGLKIYNEQKRRQIKAQEERLVTLKEQAKKVIETKRDIPPLMEKMAESLDSFVRLDAPFSVDERLKRVNQIQATLSDPRVTASEQVRQVLEAFNIEREYGRTIETYEDAIEIDGEEKVVNILRIGRLALLYQLKDQSQAGIWDSEANDGKGAWVEVSGYRLAIRDGIRMANKTAPLDLLAVPVKFKGGE
ncbi:MAG: hypothetical protein CMQ75_04545 [Gammaproteobacteria bacterium]|nr:hypothetical protein [Gammaproteobacteria bacterium]|tara:strand:- start:7892 stop:8653 length:762 start_codon:yes stop_codon:yes gene_type:complete